MTTQQVPTKERSGSSLPPPSVLAARTKRRRRLDQAMSGLVKAGGFAIIASILGILLFVLIEVWPLLLPAQVKNVATVSVATPSLLAVVVDEYQHYVVGLAADGHVRAVRLTDRTIALDEPVLAAPPAAAVAAETANPAPPAPVAPPTVLRAAVPPGSTVLTGGTSDGRVVLVPVAWETAFDGGQQSVVPRLGKAVVLTLDETHRPVEVFAGRLGESGSAIVAAVVGGQLILARREVSENAITGETSENLSRATAELPFPVSTLLLDHEQRNLYAGSPTGELLHWSLTGAELEAPQVSAAGNAGVTALSFLIGDRSLVVGQADGALSIWFQVRQPGDTFQLARIRDFPSQGSAIRAIAPSMRNKGFVAASDHRLGLYHSTSERTVWQGEAPLAGITALAMPPRADGAVLVAPGAAGTGAAGLQLARLAIRNPHPEITLRSLFGKVWYEGYEEPRYVWQSTGGTDDFEPKLSLTPLVAGTLKGTIFSLFLAIPLGVLGAMYTSQFMHPRLQRYVKPTVEIMAALPTVVLGFLAGLWLAPRVEHMVPGLALMLLVLPLSVLLTGAAWHRVPRRIRNRWPTGIEALFFVVSLAAGIGLAVQLSPWLELHVFGGSFADWLHQTTGLTYDQRNAVIVGLAMGFAVIPIIFAISEDAFSNVPRNLVSGSLALGANRWQTVTRVVLPTASPGIFSAIMVGFGRAVGETMIVLMATGNTPIMDWSPFNGFRTLSANIAVEIPEAPVGSTLYRTLFLAALALFVLTFTVNTLAELVRQRLRSRYSRL